MTLRFRRLGRRLDHHCAGCGQVPRIAMSVVLTPEGKARTGFDCAIHCGSHYCRDRAERGLFHGAVPLGVPVAGSRPAGSTEEN